MANEIAVPTGKPGELFIPALGRTIQQIEWREDDVYDSVTQASGAITAGTELVLFRDLTNKNLPHTNLTQARKIKANSEFIISRVGVVIAQAFSNTLVALPDILKVAYAGTLTFQIGDRLVTEGPLWKYQTGYGITGGSTETNVSTATTGVPSAAAAPQMLVAQSVSDKDDLVGTINFKGDTWVTGTSAMPTTAGRTVFTVVAHGLIKKPQGA